MLFSNCSLYLLRRYYTTFGGITLLVNMIALYSIRNAYYMFALRRQIVKKDEKDESL